MRTHPILGDTYLYWRPLEYDGTEQTALHEYNNDMMDKDKKCIFRPDTVSIAQFLVVWTDQRPLRPPWKLNERDGENVHDFEAWRNKCTIHTENFSWYLQDVTFYNSRMCEQNSNKYIKGNKYHYTVADWVM